MTNREKIGFFFLFISIIPIFYSCADSWGVGCSDCCREDLKNRTLFVTLNDGTEVTIRNRLYGVGLRWDYPLLIQAHIPKKVFFKFSRK